MDSAQTLLAHCLAARTIISAASPGRKVRWRHLVKTHGGDRYERDWVQMAASEHIRNACPLPWTAGADCACLELNVTWWRHTAPVEFCEAVSIAAETYAGTTRLSPLVLSDKMTHLDALAQLDMAGWDRRLRVRHQAAARQLSGIGRDLSRLADTTRAGLLVGADSTFGRLLARGTTEHVAIAQHRKLESAAIRPTQIDADEHATGCRTQLEKMLTELDEYRTGRWLVGQIDAIADPVIASLISPQRVRRTLAVVNLADAAIAEAAGANILGDWDAFTQTGTNPDWVLDACETLTATPGVDYLALIAAAVN